jgi:predicted transposase YbfD/YdcC
MEELLKYLDRIPDSREQYKVLHALKDIIVIVLFAKLANADDWQEIHQFAVIHETLLREYIELENGVPSHDTIERNFAIIESSYLKDLQTKFNEMLSSDEGEKLKKLLAIDGKTQCGNGSKNQKANHIVSAVDENGVCIGQTLVDEKSNEITAIPKLLDELNIKGQIVTIDAIGTQTNIATKIRSKKADYVLGLKGNQETLHEDVKLYFTDEDFLKKCDYYYTIEKARGGVEKREYWHTDDISWLSQRSKWSGLKTIGMTKNTIYKDDKVTEEIRYFISSLSVDAKELGRCIRGHWVVESFHWHLDVTFREDANQTLEKRAAFNLNIINKIALSVLKITDLGMKPMSLKKKRYSISLNPLKFLKMVLSA